jgi:hypothetical protein
MLLHEARDHNKSGKESSMGNVVSARHRDSSPLQIIESVLRPGFLTGRFTAARGAQPVATKEDL